MAQKASPEPEEVIIVDKHGKRHRGAAVLLDTDDVVREQAAGFVNFVRDFSVVGLALGFIVGQQANGVVKQFVDTFANPLFEFIFGKNLSGRTVVVHHHQLPIPIHWGSFVYTLLEFFFVLISIYIIIKLFKLDKLAKKKKK